MEPGEIISYPEMCQFEQTGSLQQGMTFREPPRHGVILMSQRANAPYNDSVEADGALVYEGHDQPRLPGIEPKLVDQPRHKTRGVLTQNGLFASWTERYRRGEVAPARFNVYEKLQKGIWAYRGPYLLRDYRFESDGRRRVFRFVLQPVVRIEDDSPDEQLSEQDVETRRIPTWVKQEVYKRDRGRCVLCGAIDRLHFDHVLPFSRGGSSSTPENVQLLCARHNLAKSAQIL